ncbi:MAG: aminoacyl-tRNA hydrolase [Chloroflexi bacterium]|nr:aminoacyl-tRNA hydrolase [Chloroflexota bacterium]
MERYLIVGLGNPGQKYEKTRHNIGFMTVDALAKEYNLTFASKQSNAKVTSGTISGKSVVLVKPQTFMNASGQSVRGIADFYKIAPENIIVIYDDIDIDLGILRIRARGGSGGHNGMKSIIQQLGNNQNFPRIRFGVGRPPGKMEPAAYVLRPFSPNEESLVIETIERAIKAIKAWLTDGIDTAMNLHNGTAEDVAERQRRLAESDSHQNSEE